MVEVDLKLILLIWFLVHTFSMISYSRSNIVTEMLDSIKGPVLKLSLGSLHSSMVNN